MCGVVVGLDEAGMVEHHYIHGHNAWLCTGTGRAPDTRTDLERAEAWAREWFGEKPGHVQVLLAELYRLRELVRAGRVVAEPAGVVSCRELPCLAANPHVQVRYDLQPGELDGMLCGECPDAGPVLPATMLVTCRSAPDRDLHWTAMCGPDCGDEALRHLLRQRRDGRHPDMSITLRAPAAWGAAGQVAS